MIVTRSRLFRRRAASPELPERVVRRIDEHQALSEITVGWIQLTLVGAVSLAYAVLAQMHSLHIGGGPLPWVLGAYILLTLWRLHLAYRRRLREWVSYASILLDVALPIALVLSVAFERTYAPSLYLGASIFIYVFVFVALRTLEFDVGKVLATGLLAVVGWCTLAAYAVVARGSAVGGAASRMLSAAELNLAFALIAVTAVLALAIRRNRRLLTFAVTASDTSAELARFVPAEVASFVESAETRVRAGTAETIEATVLFLDIEEFTALSERLQPEQLVRTLNAFYVAVAGELTRHDGVVMQFMGDGVLAAFNAPRPNPDHAANAVRAAIAIQAMLARTTFADAFRLHARIGINTGAVVHGMLGTPERLGYTVIGDEVNIAARLEALNKEFATAILLSEPTRVAAGDGFAFRLVDEVQLRGRTVATRIYTVDVGGADSSGSPPLPRAADAAARDVEDPY